MQTAFRISQVLVLLVVVAGASRMAGQENRLRFLAHRIRFPVMKRIGVFCRIRRNATIFGIRSNLSSSMKIETFFCRSAGRSARPTSAFTIRILALAPMTATVIFCSAICFTSTSTRDSDFDFLENWTAQSKMDELEVRGLLTKTNSTCIRGSLNS